MCYVVYIHFSPGHHGNACFKVVINLGLVRRALSSLQIAELFMEAQTDFTPICFPLL